MAGSTRTKRGTAAHQSLNHHGLESASTWSHQVSKKKRKFARTIAKNRREKRGIQPVDSQRQEARQPANENSQSKISLCTGRTGGIFIQKNKRTTMAGRKNSTNLGQTTGAKVIYPRYRERKRKKNAVLSWKYLRKNGERTESVEEAEVIPPAVPAGRTHPLGKPIRRKSRGPKRRAKKKKRL